MRIIEKVKSRWTLGSAATLVVGLVIASVWYVKTMPDSDGYVAPRSCLSSDPCARTKDNWGSPTKMRDRFDAGRLGNAKGETIPLSVRRMLTKKWNEDHGVVGKGIFDCGDHWWCAPMKASSCLVSYFLCVGETMGYDTATAVTLHCGGTAFIMARSGAPPSAAGLGGGLCLYGDIGHQWGWW